MRTLVGTLLDAQNNPISGVAVEIWLSENAWTSAKDEITTDREVATTDANGDWSISLHENDLLTRAAATGTGGTFYYVREHDHTHTAVVTSGTGDLELFDALSNTATSSGFFTFEQMEDRIANNLVQNGVHTAWTYDDTNNQLTANEVWTRRVTVDPTSGRGDYQTIKAACDYVATQSPTSTTPWLILVAHHVYNEADFTIPTFTTVRGTGGSAFFNPNSSTVIQRAGTWTGGSFCTMGANSRLENIAFQVTLDTTATQEGAIVAGETGRITNTLVNAINNSGAHRLHGVSGSTMGCQETWIIANGAGNITALKSSSLTCLRCWISDVSTATASRGVHSVGGNSTLYYTRMRGVSAWDTDLVVDAGTLYHLYSNYATSSGAGTFTNVA